MPDEARFVFVLQDESGGAAPSGGPPAASRPAVNPRTQARDAILDAGGGAPGAADAGQERRAQNRAPKMPAQAPGIGKAVMPAITATARGGVMAGAGAAAGALGVAAAVAVPTAIAAAVLNRIAKTTDELARISPDIAMARAGNRVSQVMADLRTADQYGERLAQWERGMGALGRGAQRAWRGATAPAAGQLGAAAEIGGGILDRLGELMEAVDKKGVNPFPVTSPAHWFFAAGGFETLRDMLTEWNIIKPAREGAFDLFRWFREQDFIGPGAGLGLEPGEVADPFAMEGAPPGLRLP